ncbi:hypothetical protein J6590_021585 [Homalodisca vitripennis]|nr:hypothetical protein J6590_021585 [Homalodisca vitripennis]
MDTLWVPTFTRNYLSSVKRRIGGQHTALSLSYDDHWNGSRKDNRRVRVIMPTADTSAMKSCSGESTSVPHTSCQSLAMVTVAYAWSGHKPLVLTPHSSHLMSVSRDGHCCLRLVRSQTSSPHTSCQSLAMVTVAYAWSGHKPLVLTPHSSHLMSVSRDGHCCLRLVRSQNSSPHTSCQSFAMVTVAYAWSGHKPLVLTPHVSLSRWSQNSSPHTSCQSLAMVTVAYAWSGHKPLVLTPHVSLSRWSQTSSPHTSCQSFAMVTVAYAWSGHKPLVLTPHVSLAMVTVAYAWSGHKPLSLRAQSSHYSTDRPVIGRDRICHLSRMS